MSGLEKRFGRDLNHDLNETRTDLNRESNHDHNLASLLQKARASFRESLTVAAKLEMRRAGLDYTDIAVAEALTIADITGKMPESGTSRQALSYLCRKKALRADQAVLQIKEKMPLAWVKRRLELARDSFFEEMRDWRFDQEDRMRRETALFMENVAEDDLFSRRIILPEEMRLKTMRPTPQPQRPSPQSSPKTQRTQREEEPAPLAPIL